jgi:hypothetical protein
VTRGGCSCPAAEVAILRDEAEAIYAEDRREVWRVGTALVRFPEPPKSAKTAAASAGKYRPPTWRRSMRSSPATAA